MTSKEIERFEDFLLDTFKDGILFKELRLSNEEIAYIKKKYPKVNLKKCEMIPSRDGKSWWEVALLSTQDKEVQLIDLQSDKEDVI